MTDAPLLPDDDEIVNAYLDDEATPDERARVESSPALQARVAELRHLAELVRTAPLPPPDPAARDRAIAVALAAQGAQDVATTAAPHAPAGLPALAIATGPDAVPPSASPPIGAPPVGSSTATTTATAGGDVIDLGARRRNVVPLLAAAAIALVVGIVGVSAVVRRSSSSDFITASAPQTTTRPATEAGGAPRPSEATSGAEDPAVDSANDPTGKSGGEPENGSPVAPPSSTVVAPPVSSAPSPTSTGVTESEPRTEELADAYTGRDLGPLSGPADVRRAITDPALDDGATGAVSTTRPADGVAGADLATAERCDAAVRVADREVGTIEAIATATYQGTTALLLRYAIAPEIGNANGTTRVHTVAAATCRSLDVQTF